VTSKKVMLRHIAAYYETDSHLCLRGAGDEFIVRGPQREDRAILQRDRVAIFLTKTLGLLLL